MKENVKAGKMAAAQEVQPPPVLPSSVEVSPFDASTAFSVEITELILAQPLNTIRKLEFSVAKTF